MKSKTFIAIILSIVPELVIATYLQDIWHKDFLNSILWIYGILFAIIFLRFLIGEVIFHLFVKYKMIESVYNVLVKGKFPSPWDYYEGIEYFEGISNDKNNDNVNPNIRTQSMMFFGQAKMLYDMNFFGQYLRTKRALKVAVEKYMNDYFPDNINIHDKTFEGITGKFKYEEISDKDGIYLAKPDKTDYLQEILDDNLEWSKLTLGGGIKQKEKIITNYNNGGLTTSEINQAIKVYIENHRGLLFNKDMFESIRYRNVLDHVELWKNKI